MAQVSESELKLMRIIWDHQGKAQYAEIAKILEDKGLAWKKNTIITFLTRLQEKGMLTINKIGRRNEYIAAVTEKEYLSQQTKSFVGNVYEGDVKGLVSTLLQQDLISSDELEDLQNFWKKLSDKND